MHDYHFFLQGHTTPVVEKCVTCQLPFLAPIADTICDLPGGGVVSYMSQYCSVRFVIQISRGTKNSSKTDYHRR